MSKKHKIIILILLLVSVAAVTPYLRKQYFSYKFDQVLAEAAKIDPYSWDRKYQESTNKDKYRIVIITNNGGERSYSDYLKFAAERMGWEVKIFFNQTTGHEPEIISFDPDFILFSPYTDNREMSMDIYSHRSKKYILALSPLQFMLGAKIKRKPPFMPMNSPESGTFDKLVSFSHGVLSSSKEIDFYRQMFENKKKPFYGLYILPVAPEFNFEPAEPNSLMWMSGGWDKFRSSSNYKKFINKLSENVPLKVYGHYYAASFLNPGVYDGYIPSSIEIINALRANGIYLLSHSDKHIDAATPTLRIFEAVSANVVVISDKHPFAIEHFGDNFLYYDQNADSDIMYAQVKSHMDWIKQNPEKAKAMAAKAHQIFLDKFTLEKDLIRIAKMHEFILEEEKKLGLRYSPAY